MSDLPLIRPQVSLLLPMVWGPTGWSTGAGGGGGMGENDPANVTDTGSVTARTGWTSGRDLLVEHDDLDDIHTELQILNVGGSTGVILHQSGQGGTNPWDDQSAAADVYFAARVAEGWRLFDLIWDTDWNVAPTSSALGYHRCATRVAGVIQYVFDTYGTGQFVVVGNSGGSTALAYALTKYGLGSIINVAVLCDGPPHADIYRGCNREAGNESYWFTATPGGNANLVDEAHGYGVGDDGPCYTGTESVEGALWTSSSIINMSTWNWASTTYQLFGGGDSTQAAPQGRLMGDKMETQGKFFGQVVVPSLTHGQMNGVTAGLTATGKAVNNQPQKGQFITSATASGTSHVMTFPESVRAGNLLVACHMSTSLIAGITNPAGWNLLTGCELDHSSGGLSCRILWKVASGSETTVTWTSGVAVIHQGLIMEVVGLVAPTIDQSHEEQATAVTTLAIGPTGTTTAAKEFAVVFMGTSANPGAGSFGEAWSDSFDALTSQSRTGFGIKTLTATGAVSATDSWTNAVNVIGLLATFKAS